MRKLTTILSLLAISAATLCAQGEESKPFQLSLITPLGSNGTASHRMVNDYSVNLLGGYSRGNNCFELGGWYNINTHYTRGVQLAGLFNYTGDSQGAVQVAGITNIAAEGTTPFQLAGIVNVAKRVTGVQVGLVNIAEESDGVSLGLINIVKRGGKQEFEIGLSETLHTTAAFRLGNDHLYTIFAGGVRYIDTPLEYAAGVGLGTHFEWKGGWGNQIELVGYSLTHEGSYNHKSLNLLTQLRAMVSKEFTPHFKLFAGPVLNLAITNLPQGGTTSLAPYTLWQSTQGSTTQAGWLGGAIGVRF